MGPDDRGRRWPLSRRRWLARSACTECGQPTDGKQLCWECDEYGDDDYAEELHELDHMPGRI